MLFLTSDAYHIGSNLEKVVLGVPAHARRMIASEAVQFGIPSPYATMSIESTAVNS
jgi:hypothetical protein